MKATIKKALRRFGVDVRHYNTAASDACMIQNLLTNYGIDVVFDVGANIGQYAHDLRENGFKGEIVSFEPLSSAHAELLSHSSHDPAWEVAPRVALGDLNGEVEINISGNSVSSSILEMGDRHIEAAPASVYVGVEKVRLARLDSIASQYCSEKASVFLKIDTQGYEESVLDGSTGLLPIIKAIQLEVSLVPLYEGQLLFVDMIKKIMAMNYELFSIIPGFKDPETGQMLQVDCVFTRG
jgi:FkbM family methyltransferase